MTELSSRHGTRELRQDDDTVDRPQSQCRAGRHDPTNRAGYRTRRFTAIAKEDVVRQNDGGDELLWLTDICW